MISIKPMIILFMKIYHNWIKALPPVVILAFIIFSSCTSASNPPQPKSQLPTLSPNSSNQTYNYQPGLYDPDNWANVARITVADLKQKMDDKEKLLLVDVRSPEEYAVDHLPGAILAPLNDIVSGNWLPTGSLNDHIILY